MWQVGDHLSHRFNSDLGPGRVVAVKGRRLAVEFPEAGEVLQLAAGADALAALRFDPGSRARIEATGEEVDVAACEDEICTLTDGREIPVHELWPVPVDMIPVEQLARGKVGATEDFRNRLDALRLERLREADGLGSFLGGRIHLFPHQLYAADKACRLADNVPLGGSRGENTVRWLLADEVGLGKTVEACLIMNRLIHTGEAERTLVVAPETLTVQWLGELWRKYHQIFVLLDKKRLADIQRDFGSGFNPFDAHRRTIVSLERLAANRQLTEQAVAAGIDLLVVDEAHHLRRPPGHPGNEAYRAIQPIAALGRHTLLLTATPMEDDAHGFFRLLQLLRPEELPETRLLRGAAAPGGEPLPPCASATRRIDVGGLPPRVPVPVELDRSGRLGRPRPSGSSTSAPVRRPTLAAAVAQGRARLSAPWRRRPRCCSPIAKSDKEQRELVAAAGAVDPRQARLARRSGRRLAPSQREGAGLRRPPRDPRSC